MAETDTPVFTAVAETHAILKAVGEREQLVKVLAGLREIKTMKQLAAYVAQLDQELTTKRRTP